MPTKTDAGSRDANPLETSERFDDFMYACRLGDLSKVQEHILAGVNVNGKDQWDYTPLIIASICGHFELVQLLLENGALAERNTFQGERCIYGALNDRIRKLLLQYDYTKSTDPYVYWSTHISSLLARTHPRTADVTLLPGNSAANPPFAVQAHRFLLAARAPYFARAFDDRPHETRLSPSGVPAPALLVAVRFLYLCDFPADPGGCEHDAPKVDGDDAWRSGAEKAAQLLHMPQLLDIDSGKTARLRHRDEVARAVGEVRAFFEDRVIGGALVLDAADVGSVRLTRSNPAFADCLLRADIGPYSPREGSDPPSNPAPLRQRTGSGLPDDLLCISLDPPSRVVDASAKSGKVVLYPVHKAMLIRCKYFEAMFTSPFVEGREDSTDPLRIVTVDFPPDVIQVVLRFLYTDRVDMPLEIALDVLYAADMLLLDSLKTKAAAAISTLGSSAALKPAAKNEGGKNRGGGRNKNGPRGPVSPDGRGGEEAEAEMEAKEKDAEPINIYDVIHAAWDLRVPRLETFAARYLAGRLEEYIDEEEFAELIRESASRVLDRHETDTIELLDDIRYYLDERFRLRFEDVLLRNDEDDSVEGEGAEEAASEDAGLAGAEEVGETNPNPKNRRQGGKANGTAANGEKNEDQCGRETGGLAEEPADVFVRLDGQLAKDEFERDAEDHRYLHDKIDVLLARLRLEA